MKQPLPLGIIALSLLALPGARAADEEATPAASAEAEATETAETAPAGETAAAELKAAAAKLAEAGNYSWSQSMAFGDREPRTSTGQKGSGGHVLLTMPGRNGSFEVLFRGDKAVMKRDGSWEKVAAPEQGGGRGAFLARMIENFEAPTAAAAELVSKVTELRKESDGSYAGTLGEEAARELMRFGRRRGGRGGDGQGFEPPPIEGAGGSVRFTVVDGMLARHEVELTGRMSFNGEERDIGRTTTTSFEKVGATSFDIPEVAAGLLAE